MRREEKGRKRRDGSGLYASRMIGSRVVLSIYSKVYYRTDNTSGQTDMTYRQAGVETGVTTKSQSLLGGKRTE